MWSFTDTEVNIPYLLCAGSLAYHGADIMTLYIGWNSRRKTHDWLKSSLYSKKSVSIPMDIAECGYGYTNQRRSGKQMI